MIKTTIIVILLILLAFSWLCIYGLASYYNEIVEGMKNALKDRDINLSEQEIATAMAKIKLRKKL